MGKKYLLYLVTVILLFINSITGYSQNIFLHAGSAAGAGGYTGDGTGLTSYELYGNRGLAQDNTGNLYIADYSNNRIRKIVGTTISTIAGTGVAGYLGDNGAATGARLNGPNAIVVDGAGNVFFSESGNNVVRKINGSTGVITTVAGTGTAGAGTDGVAATISNLNRPVGVAVDRRGNLYIADQYNNKIRRVNPSGIISTFAGTGTGSFSGDGGPATSATMHFPMWIRFDMWGNLFFEDRENNRIREIKSSGIVTTVAGFGGGYGFAGDGGPATTAQFQRTVGGIKFDGAGNLYFADGDNYNVRKITAVAGLISNTNTINTVAGTHTAGFSGDGGPALSATFRQLSDIALDTAGNYYVSDSGNNVIRYVDMRNLRPHFVNGYNQNLTVCENSVLNSINSLLTVFDGDASQTLTWGIFSAPNNGTANAIYSTTSTGAAITPTGLTYTPNTNFSGNDTFVVWVNDGLSMDTTRIFVNVTSFYAGLVTPDLANVCVGNTLALTHDTAGGAWTSSNTAIATVSGAGVVTGVSGGRATISYSITNSCGTTAAMTEVTVGNAILSTLAGTGVLGYTGDGGPATAATFNNTHAIAIDPSGDIYINDDFNAAIRKITTSTGIITTVAGTGTPGYSGDGVATTHQLNQPFDIVVDGSGNLYISDYTNSRIRKVNSSGIMTTIAGTGVAGSLGDGGAATAAQVNSPSGLALDAAGNLYFSDFQKIRKINTAGIISTFAGTGISGFSGDGGPATAAQFLNPNYIHFDPNGNLIVSDNGNQRYRSINQLGIISTIIGTGAIGSTGDGGPATAATLNYPGGMAFDGAGNFYFATDGGNNVRVVNKQGIISSYAGTGTAGYSGDGGPATAGNMKLTVDVAIDANGLLLVAEQTNHLIRKVLVTAPTVAPITGPTLVCNPLTITLADVTTGGVWSSSATGIATVGSSNGVVTGVSSGTATISYSVNFPCGTLYSTQVVTVLMPPSPIVVEPGIVCPGFTTTLTDPTLLGAWSSSNTSIATVVGGVVTGVSYGIAIISYSIVNACGTMSALASVTVGSPIINTIAGNGSATYAGDNTAATTASINAPTGAIADAAGNVYIVDFSNNRIRKVNTSGIITTIAGTGVGTFTADNIAATNSAVNQPTGICFDPAGNLYIADYGNNRVRKINTSGIISTVAGTGIAGYSGDGAAATNAKLSRPSCLVSDPSGNIYFTDGQNCVVRKISTTGIITTIAGTGTPGYTGDNVLATTTPLWFPFGIAMDTYGNIYIADQWSNRIREINTAGIITTVAGTGASGSGTGSYGGDGGAATLAHINNPSGVAFDGAGNMFIGDYYSNIIREVNTSGIINTIVGTPTSSGFSGDGGPATGSKIFHPNNVWLDNNGNIFIPDAGNNRVREVYITNSTVAPITGPTSVCKSSTIILADVTPAGIWTSSATGVATVGSTTGIVTGIAAGTTIITYTVTFQCGVLFSTQTITVNPLPVISGPTSFCVGNTATYTSIPSGGTWTSGSVVVATIGSSTGIATGVSAGTVIFTDSLGTGCKSTYSVTVNPSPAVITGPASVCTGSTVTLNDISGTTTWSSSNNLVATVGSGTGIVTGIGAGTATISFTLATGCFATRIETVNATPAIIVGANNICLGASTTLSDATGTGSWVSSNTTVATIGSGTGIVLGASVGTTTISYILPSGCYQVFNITVNNTPAAITGPTSVCTGLNITLNDVTGTGNWSSSNTIVATIGSGTGVVSGLTAGTTTITYSLGTGCIATYIITVNASPAAISGATSICLGATTTFTDATGTGSWISSNTAAATIGSTSGFALGVGVGVTTISYILPSGCYSQLGLVVNNSPSAITGPTSVCTGANITLNDVTGSGSWTSSNTTVATIGSTTGVVTGLTAGTTTITYSLGTGCNATYNITVNLTPAAITGTNNICVGGTTTLNDATGSGTWSSSNTSVATIGSSSAVVTGISAGTTTISYTLAGGCSQTFAMTINPTPAAITGPTSVCTGSTITLNDVTGVGVWSSSNTGVATVGAGTGVVTGVATGTSIITYALGTCIATTVITVNLTPVAITGSSSLCVGASTILSDLTPGGSWLSSTTSVATIGSLTGNLIGVGAGTTTISYVMATGCLRTTVFSVNSATSAISGANNVCLGFTTTLTDGGGGSWSTSNASVATIGSGTGVVTGTGVGTATITYTLGAGCTATMAFTVNANPVAITPSGSINICSGSNLTLSDGTSGGTWSSGSTVIATVGVGSGLVTGVAPGTATISYILSTGCYATDVVTIKITPVAITPSSVTICTSGVTTLSDATSGGVWTSSNIAIATVGTGTGVVTGVTTGTVIITYSIGSCFSTGTVNVTTVPTVAPIVGAANVCNTVPVVYTDATSGGVWSSSNTSVASVGSTTGVVTGITSGTAIISYTITTLCGSVSATSTVNISVFGAGTISGPSIICSGMFTTMTDAVSGGVWSVTNANATITGGGGLTGISAGIDTIKYTVTNVCGTAVTSKTISVGAFLTAGAISGGTTVCAGATLTLTDPATGGVWSSSNGSASVAGGVVTGLSAGVDTISYSVSSSCGTAVATHTITVNAAPVAGTITGLYVICAGSFTTYTNSVGGGTWNVTNTSATINSSGILTAVTAGTDTIKYTVSNSCGTAIATHSLLIGPFLSAGSISGASSVCVGANVSLTDPVPGGVWSPTNTNASVGSTGTVTGLIAGPVTISYTVSSACGVIAATHSMTINPLPVAGTITGPANLCTGSPVTYTDASSGGTWSISNSRATISAGGLVTPLFNGLDTITYTVTNGCGTVTTTQTISIGTAATAGTITGPASLCGTASITLSDAVTGGTWSASNGHATVSGGVVTGVTPGIDTIIYTVTNTCGTATATAIVVINPIPVVYSIVGPNSVCAGSFTIYTDTAAGGVWSLTNSSATITSAGVLSALVPGATDTIIYTITNSCGTATTSKAINIGILLSAGTISGPSNVCVGSGIILTDGVSGGVWTSSNTAVATVGTSGVVIGVSSGTSMITYTYSNTCGSVYTTAMVNVNPAPNAGTITGPSTVCAGSYTTYSDAATGGTWSVTNSSATITSGGIFIAITPFATDTIMYTVTTACSTAVATKVVSIGTLISSGVISGPSSVCISGTATLSNSVSGGVWTSGNTSVAIIGTSTGVVNGITIGTSTISYTVNLACGSATSTSVISVSPIPNAGTIGGAPTVCAGSSITLTETATSGVWSSSNATATVTSGGVVNGVIPGIDTILYTVTNGCGTAIATKTITITTVPSVGPITGPASVCQLANMTLLNGISGGVWTSSNSAVASIGSLTGIVTGGLSGSAVINYTVSNACGSTIGSKTITVSPLADPGSITGPDSLCITTTTTYIDFTPGGFWSVGNTNATITSGGVATGMAVGTVPVSYSVTNGCGTQSAVKIVTIVPSPFTATITGSSAVCVGSVLSLADSIPGGTWTSTNSNAVVTGPGLITGANAGTDTIIYIVTNICGTATTRKVITINPMPVIAPITGSNRECTGSSITLADATSGGFWTSSSPAIASVGSTTGVVTGNSAGTAAITYTVINSFGCGTGALLFDTVILTPATPPIGGSTYVCLGGTTTLTNTSPGGTWTSSDISIATIDAATGVMSGIAAGTVIVTYAQVTTCGSSTATRVETVSPLPTVAASTGAMHECPGSTTTLSNSTTGGLWSSADNTIATVGSTTGIVTGVATGTVAIVYTYTNGLGCTNSVSAIDTVNSSLALSPITGTTSECVGATTTLSNATPGGVWTSSNPAVATVGATTGIVTGVATGNTTIVYTVTSSGCSGSVSIGDTVNNLPTVAAITGPVSECQGTTVTLSNATAGGIWSSSNPAIASIGSLSGVVTGNTTGNVNIYYSVSAGAGCTTTVLAHDTVLALPFVAGITGTVSVCVGATSTLSDATTGGIWSSGSIFAATIGMSTGLVTGISAGTSDITYTVVNSRGCHSTVGTIVSIVAAPTVAAITGTTNECIGATSTLTNATTGGIWTSSNPSIASVGSLTGIVTGISAGAVNILYTVSSGSGCSTSVSTPDTVNAYPVHAPITGSLNVCIGSTSTLANTVAGGVWTSANTTLATINPSTGVVSGLSIGTDRIYYTVSNGCGSIMDSTNITINPLPTAGTITAAYTNLCAGTTIHLSESVTGGAWGSENPAIATVNTSGTVTGVSAGTVIITYKVTSSAGCVNTASAILTIGGSLGSISVLPSGSATLCNNGSITMHVSTTTTGLTYQWMRGGAPIGGATNFSYTTTTAGSYSVMIGNGTCSETLAGPSIVAPPNPVIGFTSPNILYTGSTYASYQWYLNSVMIAGANTSSYHYTNGGLYTVSVTDGNGCGGTSLPYAVTGVNGVNDVNGAELIKIYPNPATTILNIEAQKSINVVLYSMDGKMLIEQKDATSINIAGLANGLYLIMIYDQDNHLIQTSKFTKAE